MVRLSLWYLLIVAAYSAVMTAATHAQPAAPEFESRPGAAYTLFLNFSGFNFTGSWGNTGQTPGNMGAYRGQTGAAFTPTQQAEIRNIWSRVAEAHYMYNINVTTIDPAVTVGGFAPSDFSARQRFYDQTARVMHSVVGTRDSDFSNFYSGAGGVSFVGVWQNSYTGVGTTNGLKTNWNFIESVGGAGAYHNLFSVISHENGHAAGLSHQGDYTGSTRVNEYSSNRNSSSLRPIMGVGYSSSRNAWAVGRVNTTTTTIQNDAGRILQNNGMGGFMDDGIGRTLATATALHLDGETINPIINQGIIVPVSNANPNPLGVDSYTRGFFSFETRMAGINTITVNAGTQFLAAGIADPHASLDATLRILDSNGNQLAISNTASLSETISLELGIGQYFVEVSSAGGKVGSLGPSGNWEPKYYFDMGAYFLTGSILAVPEPGTGLVLLVLAAVLVLTCRRQKFGMGSC
jgi:hypothetical protein